MNKENNSLRKHKDSDSFLLRCVNNKFSAQYDAVKAVVGDCEDAATIRALLVNCDDETVKMSQAYAEASKQMEDSKHWFRLRAMLGDKVFKTISDASGVLVGNEGAQFLILNNHGDGETRVAIVEEGDWNNHMARYCGTISGSDLCVYTRDCPQDWKASPWRSNHIAKRLCGVYDIYVFSGIVIFEKRSKKA